MEQKIIVLTPDNLSLFLLPIQDRLERIEKALTEQTSDKASVYNDEEASLFLKVSKKKLQQLRNKREIGFIRENGGRRILYRHEHLLEYLQANELKKKR